MNIKLIAVAAACFVVGTGGGAVLHMRGAAAKAAETALHADTTHVDSLQAAAHRVEEPAHGDETDTHDDTEPHATTDASHDVAATGAAYAEQQPAAQHASEPIAAAASLGDTIAAPGADSSAARLARIFGAMKPEEAARLLEPLPESDVRAVLFSLSDRKAAAILANFKGERATALARALIANGGAH